MADELFDFYASKPFCDTRAGSETSWDDARWLQHCTTNKSSDDPQLAPRAVTELSHTILVFDAFYDVQAKAEQGNEFATQVLNSWSEAEWFTSRDPLQHKLTFDRISRHR